MVVLGIDPGLSRTGFGLIQINHLTLKCIEYGCISPKADNFAFRLKYIYDNVSSLIEKYGPRFVAFEDVFFSRNAKSALILGQARGAALLAAANMNKNISVYSPREVKQALTGNGAASKEQVRFMVERLLELPDKVSPLDASDALAVAICHFNRTDKP